MRHCMKILTDFNKKSLYQIASPFYEPVDVAFVPTYYKTITRPMDLGTMCKKLDEGNYPNSHAFHNDFRLMIKNCMIFNPPDTAPLKKPAQKPSMPADAPPFPSPASIQCAKVTAI
ncbi:hypothetical protein FS749_000747 [Ceratobasidium sp. UAMH 11750]|nr:hypothetical protein FS749_000747 [Ceratobasidium sp. UAMH 11750]